MFCFHPKFNIGYFENYYPNSNSTLIFVVRKKSTMYYTQKYLNTRYSNINKIVEIIQKAISID